MKKLIVSLIFAFVFFAAIDPSVAQGLHYKKKIDQ